MAERLLVITSCTGKKAIYHTDQLRLLDFRTPERLAERERSLAKLQRPAGQMYTGRQHQRLMEGVRRLRQKYGHDEVNVQIVSAGYGLVPEGRLIAPYEATFNEMGLPEMRDWAKTLGIAAAVRTAAAESPLVIFLLGSRYLEAVEPPVVPDRGQRFVFFAKSGESQRLQAPGVTVVPAGKREATAYGEGLVALKGKMFALLANALVQHGEPLWAAIRRDDTPHTIVSALTAQRSTHVTPR